MGITFSLTLKIYQIPPNNICYPYISLCQSTQKLKQKDVRTDVLGLYLKKLYYKRTQFFKSQKTGIEKKKLAVIFLIKKLTLFRSNAHQQPHKNTRLLYGNLVLHISHDYTNVLLHHTSSQS